MDRFDAVYRSFVLLVCFVVFVLSASGKDTCMANHYFVTQKLIILLLYLM